MKKILLILAVAAVVLSMASCALGGSDRYKDGSRPMIDDVKHTVNGMYYDADEERCWLVVTTVENVTTKHHVWTNHFDLVVFMENEMWAYSKAGKKASYGLTVTAELEYETCSQTEDFQGW